jgi:serine/threonine protein kinase
MFQVLQALTCLAFRLHLKHGDLHDENIMVTVTSTKQKWSYILPDDSIAVVPSFGMCVKLIDFGQASRIISGETDKDSISFEISFEIQILLKFLEVENTIKAEIWTEMKHVLCGNTEQNVRHPVAVAAAVAVMCVMHTT